MSVEAKGFDAWLMLERHAKMGQVLKNGISLSIFHHSKYLART